MTPTSAIEFLMWLLIAASVIAVLATRFRTPYTVALVLGGLALGSLRLPIVEKIYQSNRPEWLTPEVVLILFLPPLLFEGSLKINFRQLRSNLLPILLLANAGVLAATVITGYALHWEISLPLATALLFGAIISATDPISVLAIFKEMAISHRLAVIIEGESLLNDGTAVVLFQVLLAGIVTGDLGVGRGIGSFVQSVVGGALVGLLLGYVCSKVTERIDEPQIEITITTILAYSSYLIAHHLHLSGVLATVLSGITVGNLGARRGMNARTRLALWSFWEYASFVINSLVFLLIGMEVHIWELVSEWSTILLAVFAVILGRAVSVYGLVPISNLFGRRIPIRWQHMMVWGGLHGSLSLALALSLSESFPYREKILALTFGVVAFSIIVQGLTIRPLVGVLGLSTQNLEDVFSVARVEQIALSACQTELKDLMRTGVISGPVYNQLGKELEEKASTIQEQIGEMYTSDPRRAASEMQMARMRLAAAKRSSIEEAVRAGFISAQAADKLLETKEVQSEAEPGGEGDD
ncbi:MAG TPA: Na+/H+ antiporter [Candidatus Eisenbacteria bacterium]|nr:Na+/H+ antiporter [Candidatus Eisenbacteria bacterium]